MMGILSTEECRVVDIGGAPRMGPDEITCTVRYEQMLLGGTRESTW